MKIAIVGMNRTPFAKFNGGFKDLAPNEIATAAVKGLLEKEPKLKDLCDKVILGEVFGAGVGQNPARFAAVKAGLSEKVTAMTVNQVCGSGLLSLDLAAQMLETGRAQCIIAGGVDSFTKTPLLKDRFTEEITDSFDDGLADDFSHEKMGVTAENVARAFHITREEQDIFAYQSQQKAKAAQEAGKFAKVITPVAGVEADECLRPNSSLEKLATLKTVFAEDGTVTAGNSSALSDGAAVVALMTEEKAKAEGLPVLATIQNFVEVGMDPEYMGVAPILAIQTLCQKEHRTIDDYDYIELNEAFASQSVACQKELNIPEEKLNIWGGAIALGHPLGASGTRLVMQMVQQLEENDKHLGLVSLCIGGGMGMALEVVREK